MLTRKRAKTTPDVLHPDLKWETRLVGVKEKLVNILEDWIQRIKALSGAVVAPMQCLIIIDLCSWLKLREVA
jgi:hypothetical protein